MLLFSIMIRMGILIYMFAPGPGLKVSAMAKSRMKLPENHLYRNRGDGTFEDVTRKAGVGGPWYSMGVTVGDYNNDGYPDLFVSNYGQMFFIKITETAHLPMSQNVQRLQAEK